MAATWRMTSCGSRCTSVASFCHWRRPIFCRRYSPPMVASLLKNLCVDFKGTNLILDRSFLLIPHDSQIKLRLKIEPKIGSRSEHISKPKSHLRRDTALLLDDIVDAWSRNVQSQCQLISVQVKRHHKLFSKNLARMNWFQSSHVPPLSHNLQSRRGRRLRRATQNR